MKTQCCQPLFGTPQCNDCPLTVPLYRQPVNLFDYLHAELADMGLMPKYRKVDSTTEPES